MPLILRAQYLYVVDQRLQPLPGKHQRGDTGRIARPPQQRPDETQCLGLNEDIGEAVCDAGQGVPCADGVDCFAGDAGLHRQEDCTLLVIVFRIIREGKDILPATKNGKPSTALACAASCLFNRFSVVRLNLPACTAASPYLLRSSRGETLWSSP